MLLASLAAVFPPGAHATGVGGFEGLASSPAPLTSVAVDTSTNILFAQENDGRKFFSFDPRTDAWGELPEAPLPSGGHGGAAYLGGKIYASYVDDPDTLDVYDIETETWSTITNPLHEGTADITAFGEDLYMVEGARFVAYDPAKTKATTLAAPPSWAGSVHHTRAQEEKGELYCDEGFEPWGGLQGFQGRIYGDQGNECRGFAVYDIASNSWKELPDLPEGAVTGSALDPISGTYFAYGPYEGTDFYSYEIASEQWSTSTAPFTEVDDGGMAYVGLPGNQGIYAVEGEPNEPVNGGQYDGFTRYVTPEAEGKATLSVTNAASAENTFAGAEITYTIRAANGGPNDATNAMVTDSLPAGVSFVAASASRGNCSGTATVECDLGTLGESASATVTITVRTETPGTVTDSAAVSSEEEDPHPEDDEASASTAVAPAADLTLSDAGSVASTSVGSTFQYVLHAVNGGPDEAMNVALGTSMSANVSVLSATVSRGECSVSTSVSCSLGTLASGAAATVTLTVKANASGAALSSATVASEDIDPRPDNNSASASVLITAASPSSTAATVASEPSASAAPGSGAPPTLEAARMIVPSGKLRLGPGAKVVSLRLANPNGQLTLRGTAQLVTYTSTHHRRSATVLGTAAVSLAPGATRTFELKLGSAALVALRAHRTLHVQLVLTIKDSLGRTVKTVGSYVLVAVAPKHGK